MKGPLLQFPVAFGAITVSYNLPGVKSGLKLDGPTLADIFSGKIKTWNDSGDQGAEPGHEPAQHRDHRRPPLGLLGHHGRLHHLPVRRQPDVEVVDRQPARTSSGRSAPARRRTPASRRRSSRPRARSATSSRPTRWRTASRTRRSRTRPAPTCCRRSRHLGGGRRGQGPGGPRDLDDQLAQPDGVPDRLADVPGRPTRTRARPAASQSVGERPEEVPDLRVRRRPADARRGPQPAPVRAAAGLAWRPRTTRSWRR